MFVLATTGPERVLPTIRSRTQHFEFTLYTVDELAGHLADVCAREGVDADPAALDVIARAAAGSMRDALSLARAGDRARHARARARSPRCSAAPASSSACACSTRSRTRTCPVSSSGLGELLDAGHDPRRITEDLLGDRRATRSCSPSAKGRVRVDAPDDQVARLAELGEQVGQAMLVRVLETFGQAVVDMRGTDAADPRLVLEIALVRLARREAGPPLQVLLERVERLERASAGGTLGATRDGGPRAHTIGGARGDARGFDSVRSCTREPAAPAAAPGRSGKPSLGAIRAGRDAPDATEPPAARASARPGPTRAARADLLRRPTSWSSSTTSSSRGRRSCPSCRRRPRPRSATRSRSRSPTA